MVVKRGDAVSDRTIKIDGTKYTETGYFCPFCGNTNTWEDDLDDYYVGSTIWCLNCGSQYNLIPSGNNPSKIEKLKLIIARMFDGG